ncbi:MAG: hypothetical protein CSB46_04130 [Micrococcales bacterium]|nr:MAG: hypothetical protein CSB46_04130 [Micrococcales bacterium]
MRPRNPGAQLAVRLRKEAILSGIEAVTALAIAIVVVSVVAVRMAVLDGPTLVIGAMAGWFTPSLRRFAVVGGLRRDQRRQGETGGGERGGRDRCGDLAA